MGYEARQMRCGLYCHVCVCDYVFVCARVCACVCVCARARREGGCMHINAHANLQGTTADLIL